MKMFSLLCATSALVLPAMAMAQSTGSQTVDEEIVITGARAKNGVDGFLTPDSTKAKAVLTQELIERQIPGQTILNTINLIPGVNFTNSDAYGSSGGNLRIRGFDGARISLTFDGMPLNDTGNYAIYSNQQLDSEIIDQVNVNLGATDVDSPTASAAGGTVNYRSRIPGDTLGAQLSASYGENDYHRVFGMIDTGILTSFGTKAFVSASVARNDKFKGPGRIEKQQYNAKIYQPLGDNGDFIAIGAHYNENRNNFYRNPSVNDLRTLFGETVVPLAANATPANPIVIGDLTKAQEDAVFAFENNAFCVLDAPTAGVADNDGAGSSANPNDPAGCTNFHGLRINPSNTGNVRAQSRFMLADGLILTVDPSFQYTLANGGGTTVVAENSAMVIGASGLAGVDLNGDGDLLDRVRLYTPNTTNTRRYGVTASLIWDVAPEHRVRLAYTFDRGRHRQTGDYGYLSAIGHPENVFGGRNGRPVLDGDGNPLQQRDRLSIALLHQVAGQYVGRFMDDALRVELGLRAPFFKRSLNQYCYTQTGGSGFATCTGQPGGPGVIVAPDAQGPFPANSFFAPFEAEYKFDKLLPNVGATYRLGNAVSLFASYAKGFSAPRTDNLYRTPRVDVAPETTDAFDLGIRYTSGRVQAQATAWHIAFQNRIVSAFNQDLGISLDRNIGDVDSYGVDASIAYKPVDAVSLYAFGSYIDTEIKNDLVISPTVTLATGGKFMPETPKWQLGGRAQFTLGPVELGGQVKWVGDRFATELNDVKVKGYTLVDLDARFSLASFGLEKSWIQLNVSNLFDTFYFGNLSTQPQASNNPNFSVGAPRTVLGTLHIGF